MNRDYILETNVIGRYVSGELTELEAEQFELAYFQDEELAALVETEQALQREFGHADHSAVPTDTTRSGGARVGFRWGWAAAIAGVVALIPLSYFVTQSTDPAPFYLSESRPMDVSRVVYNLERMRGTTPALSVPIPDDPDGNIVLAIPIHANEYSELRLSLRYEDEGEPVWLGTWHKTDFAPEYLYLTVSATALYQGDYVLKVEQSMSGTIITDGSYEFRADSHELNSTYRN